MKKDLAEEYIELIKIAKEKKKENELLYPIYKHSNTLLKSIKNTRELRLDAYLADEIIGEESKRIFLQCSNNITVSSYIDLVSTNLSAHKALANAQYRGAHFPPVLSLRGHITKAVRKPKKQKTEKDQEKANNDEQETQTDEIDAPKEIKKIYRILKEKKEVELFRLVIDPNSFGKTIENILTLSFTVKVGRAFITEKEGVLYATLERVEEPIDTHCIISVTEEDVKRIAHEMDIRDTML
ncbi:hypothetical protein NEMIN01_2125 [Nematocida minor]|uniref:uncharacterized protein n=1 Tax=Nematocida minor TaxID=1912983 RepID=UPI002220EB74|nr:uncharacterized protein NEMIN01_2125 [Nematocida minor]KAI5192637.1 hypothetical protein NEMIN01_2125 [Nematocida minor]